MPNLHNVDPCYLSVDGDTAQIGLSGATKDETKWKVKSPEHCETVQVLHNVRYNVTIAILHSRLEPDQTYNLWMTGDCSKHPEQRTGSIKQSKIDDSYYFNGLQPAINDFLRNVIVKN